MSGLRRSWVESANSAETDFPLNNLPYGVLSEDGRARRCGVAIGDRVLDLAALERGGWFDFGGTLSGGDWRDFMRRGRRDWDELRRMLQELLAEGAEAAEELRRHLHRIADVTLHLPFTVSEYTDFYASRHHAFNVGSIFRGPENALPPNWLHMPIGYNGRASSVVVSGTDVVRPHGQIKGSDDDAPRFAPSERFDFELEVGAVVGQASEGPLEVAEAFDNIFGYVLLNDWSARDIQAWEYQPLGPFQSKATATTISPWIVTASALEPFRVSTPPREVALLDYLKEPGPMLYDIDLSVSLTPDGGARTVISRTSYSGMYYSAAQQLAHHASSGCPMRVGDLLGSGTVSGSDRLSCGSLLELGRGGEEPIRLEGGATRAFVEDGDVIGLSGHAQGDGYRIGFGPCEGRVLPARRMRG